jgi:hypothetical protein
MLPEKWPRGTGVPPVCHAPEAPEANPVFCSECQRASRPWITRNKRPATINLASRKPAVDSKSDAKAQAVLKIVRCAEPSGTL